MKSEKDYENVIDHVNRIINNLNQHWHSIQLLLSHVSKPLLVDDRGLANVICQVHNQFREIIDSIKNLDLTRTYGEIKFIGMRLNEIESTLKKIQSEGIKKNIQLDFIVDGYQMVKKPVNYEREEQIEEPNDNLKKLLDTLTSREAKAIIHRLGLFGEKKNTYVKMAEIFGVTRDSCSQIFNKAIRKLRHPSRREIMEKVSHSELRKLVFD